MTRDQWEAKVREAAREIAPLAVRPLPQDTLFLTAPAVKALLALVEQGYEDEPERY